MPPATRLALVITAVLCWIIAGALALRRHRQLQRAQAALARDLEAAQRRRQRDEEEAARAATKEALLALLPVLDNLDRALAAAQSAAAEPPAPSTLTSMIEGLQLTRKSFLDALRGLGVEPVPAAGQPFDPHLHEATLQVESTELDPGTVATVYQQGFRMGARLLRPAQVAVSRRP